MTALMPIAAHATVTSSASTPLIAKQPIPFERFTAEFASIPGTLALSVDTHLPANPVTDHTVSILPPIATMFILSGLPELRIAR